MMTHSENFPQAMPRRSWFAQAALVWGLGCLSITMIAGCGLGSEASRTVAGQASYAGQPIEQGTFTLEPAIPGKKPVAGPITAGKFSVNCPVGKWRVVISAFRTADTPGPDGKPHFIEYVPKQYNLESTTFIEVAGNNLTDLKYDLQAPAAKKR